MAPPMTPQSEIARPASIDTSNITLGAPKLINGGNGSKIIPLYHKGAHFMVQFPQSRCPYGLSTFESDGKPGKTTVDLSLSDPVILAKMLEFDDVILNEAMNNSLSWLKKKHTTIDVIRALYTPTVRYSKNKDTGEINKAYDPTIKVNLRRTKEGDFDCKVFNMSKEEVTLDTIELKGAKVAAIAYCTLWVAGGKFGCTWTMVQMKVDPRETKLVGYAFIDDSDEDDN